MNRLRLVAECGDAKSRLNLGVMYDRRLDDDDNGRATGDDRLEAIRGLLHAARQGLPRAQRKLAELIAMVSAGGPQAPENYVKACSSFLLATTNMSGIYRQRAQSGYQRVSSHLAPAQIAKATRLARDARLEAEQAEQ